MLFKQLIRQSKPMRPLRFSAFAENRGLLHKVRSLLTEGSEAL
jgi:hypothetical protein